MNGVISIKAFFSATLVLSAAFFSSGQNVKNPALNPVRRMEPAPKHDPLVLVADKKPAFAIVYDFNSEKDVAPFRQSIHNSVKVLQRAFKKCAGLDIPIVDAADTDAQKKYPFLFFVGKSSMTDKLGMKPLELPPEGFEIMTFDKGIAIVGHDGSLRPDTYSPLDDGRYCINGTQHGAYDFIERFMGVRFYYPGLGTIWPEMTELSVQPIHYSDWPEIKNRHQYLLAYGNVLKSLTAENIEIPQDVDLSFCDYWRSSEGTRFLSSHAPVPQAWLNVHPDKTDIMFYKARNGHLYYEPRQNTGNYLDVSNLEVADLFVQDCVKYYETNGKYCGPWGGRFLPNPLYVMFGQADTFMSFMDNDTIEKLKLIPESRKNSRSGMLSDVYARFYIAMANEMKKTLPGRRLSVLAYHNYLEAPVNPEYRKFPENIDVQACIYGMPMRVKNEATVKTSMAILKDWYEVLGGRPVAGMWLYTAGADIFARSVGGQFVGEVQKTFGKYLGKEYLFLDLNTNKVDWDMYCSWYSAYRSLWNPDFDVKAALHEHWPLLYGKAAPYLEEFNTILVDSWDKQSRDPENKSIYSLAVLEHLETLLKEAEKSLAPDSIEMKRYKLFAKRWPAAIAAKRKVLLFEKPVYGIKYLKDSDTVNVDGKITEPCWDSADIMPMNDPMGNELKHKTAVRPKLLWNKDGVYASFVIDAAPLADKNKTLWNNCNVELFLSPGLDLNDYFHFAIDSLEELCSGQRTLKPVDTPYNGNWKCPGLRHAINIDADKWSVEVFIPFNGLDVPVPKVYSCWYANFILNKKTQPEEYLSYSLTLGNNHNVTYYGLVKFLGRE